MSDTREKLKKLLFDVPCESECEGELGSCPDRKYGKCKRMDRLEYCTVQKIADHLLANGVTVQKWIPVSERLPEPLTDVLSYRGHRNLIQEDCVDEKGRWYSEYKYSGANVTHWMPMPEPPKEGE